VTYICDSSSGKKEKGRKEERKVIESDHVEMREKEERRRNGMRKKEGGRKGRRRSEVNVEDLNFLEKREEWKKVPLSVTSLPSETTCSGSRDG
jgi:hypothetical protein